MRQSIHILLLLLISFTQSLWSQDTLRVPFILDMREPLREGWLNPENERVGLRGDFYPLSWGKTHYASDVDQDGLYEITIPFVLSTDSTFLAYKIKVDGSNNPDDGWQAGRNHTLKLNRISQTTVKLSWTDQATPPPPSFTGNVQVVQDFDSSPLKSRNLYIYLPPGYKDSGKSYPVLYMHDGQNIFDASEAGQEWRMDEWAESLIADGEIEPMIIVGVGNTSDRILEYTPTEQIWEHRLTRVESDTSIGFTGSFLDEGNLLIQFKQAADTQFVMVPDSDEWQPIFPINTITWYQSQSGIFFELNPDNNEVLDHIKAYKPAMGGEGPLYAAFLLNTVKPYIDLHYRTLPDAAHTAVGGSSLGGLISMHMALEYPDQIGHFLVVSPSVWWDNRIILQQVRSSQASIRPRIWLDAGTDEGPQVVPNTKDLYDQLLNSGWKESDIHYEIFEKAQHTERAWSERAGSMLRFINTGFSSNTVKD